METKFTFKENWYFLRQDILSYLMSTALYLSLCFIRESSLQSVTYGLFECLVFYIPFWIIRMNFSHTYHSDVWAKCKFLTRLMLCCGVFVIWIMPIRYSLFNCLFVAFICCLILYYAGLAKEEKNRLKETIIEQDKKLKRNIHDMSDDEFVDYCKHKGLSQQDIMIATCIYRKRLKGQELYDTIGYSKPQTIRIRKRISKCLEDDT